MSEMAILRQLASLSFFCSCFFAYSSFVFSGRSLYIYGMLCPPAHLLVGMVEVFADGLLILQQLAVDLLRLHT